MVRGFCSGRLLRRAIFVLSTAAVLANAQTTRQSVSKTTAHHANELSLAGLRPGRDSVTKAIRLFGKPTDVAKEPGDSLWVDDCRSRALTIEQDPARRIQIIRLAHFNRGLGPECKELTKDPWRTGLGLSLQNSTDRLIQLYGQPDSKSPSTRDGQPLELWYYAFDWAGPDVPQVMEVLCTREHDGQPGRVIEITLAAPSL